MPKDELTEFLILQEKTEIDWNQRFIEREMNPDKFVEDEKPCLKIHQSRFDIDIFTLNNFSCIVGMAKSRKSFLASLFIAAFAKKGWTYDKFYTEMEGKIVLFDTEQGTKHLKDKLKAIEKMAGDFHNVWAYGLRPDTPAERVEFIDKYLLKYSNNIKLVIIDGIRDLLTDINSAEQSTELVSRLMKWTYDYNIHIITVIHQNKEGGYARGHIGTEIMNKSETVIKVIKENMITRVTCEYSRGIPFDDFIFSIEDGIPMIGENEKIKQEF